MKHEGDRAVGITELTHAEEVVGESVHDEAIVNRQCLVEVVGVAPWLCRWMLQYHQWRR